MIFREKVDLSIEQSDLISRDLSWLQFNKRVLDQVKDKHKTIFERLKFLAITTSNLDEFFMVRIGSLYNYLDYNKQRLDYSGLREVDFRIKLLEEVQTFVDDQHDYFNNILTSLFQKNNFNICEINELTDPEQHKAHIYFKKTIFPMLTPMVSDLYHTFPLVMNHHLTFGIVTNDIRDGKDKKKLSFVMIPQNIPRFFEIERINEIIFVPIESVIRKNIKRLFRNVEISSVNLFRISRNGDHTIEESEDIETGFIEEIKRNLKKRKTGRVVRMEIETNTSKWMIRNLKIRWDIDQNNIFESIKLIDYTGLLQIINHSAFKYKMPKSRLPVTPVTLRNNDIENIFYRVKKNDILLHHPFNSIDYLLELLESAAIDPNVLSIKITIYRLAKNSRISNALLKAIENGKHVSVLFELKARFDEENNIREAKKLQQAGCFVIHGVGTLKTHTKLCLIVRKEGDKVTRFVHMASGNYNEFTSKLYTDLGLMTTKDTYAQDVAEFFNAITGHSKPSRYNLLLTAPNEMRNKLITLIREEAENAKKGLPSGVAIKVNSLQDDKIIKALYKASQAGVKIQLIIRGICCLRPGRKGLSENIEVRSLVGNYLEHSRIYYFHNNNDPILYGGSADIMVRSFDRRIESLFQIVDEKCRKEVINILQYNLKDNINSYIMNEDGTYSKIQSNGKSFNSHLEFYKVTGDIIEKATIFGN